MDENVLTNVCRTCLAERGEFQSIFANGECTGLDMHLAEMIMAYTSAQITFGDGLPEQICLSCANKATEMYMFKKLCEESDMTLREKLGKSPLLLQSQDDNDGEDLSRGFDVDVKDVEVLIKSEICNSVNNLEDKGNLSATYEYVKVLDNDIDLSESVVYECEQCLQVFPDIKQVNDHKKIHEVSELFQCDICPKIFTNQSSVQKHKLMHDIKVEDKNVSDSSVCGSETLTEAATEGNVLPHTPTFEGFKVSNAPNGKKQKPDLECFICTRKFNKPSHLTRHLKIHNPIKPHACKVCYKRYARLEQLTTHMNIHMGVKPHVCEICFKGFNQISNLKDHMRTHNGEKPFLCSTCGKGFNQLGNLRQHTIRHSGVKAHVCTFCGNGFASKGELCAHLRKHTDGAREPQPEPDPRTDKSVSETDSEYLPDSNESSSSSVCNFQDNTTKLQETSYLRINANKDVENEDIYCNKQTHIQESSKNSMKRIKRKHYCLYCCQDVANFSRHLERNHAKELEVKKFITLEKKSKHRKKILDKLRKQGDFCTSKVVPVKTPRNSSSNNYICCIFCRGYYKSTSLRRHSKNCFFNPDPSARLNAQIEGQNLMVGPFDPNDPLKVSGLLDMMRADEISMVAKKDKIICEVARRYIKTHRKKQQLIVAKRYMRRLSRLLICVRETENNLSLGLLDILNPRYFQLLIIATKTIAEYDEKRRLFKFPSLALQLGTLIKHAINSAILFEFQKKKCCKEKIDELKTLKTLIETKWALEVSSEAVQNMAAKFNKSPLIPILEDIKIIDKSFDQTTMLMLPKEDDTEIFKGKCFEEINIPEYIEESENHGGDNNDEEDIPLFSDALDQSESSSGRISNWQKTIKVSIMETKTTKNKRRTLIPWTTEQKKVTEKYFSNHIKNKIAPKKDEVMALKEKYPKLFSNKPYPTIKVYIWNKYRNK